MMRLNVYLYFMVCDYLLFKSVVSVWNSFLYAHTTSVSRGCFLNHPASSLVLKVAMRYKGNQLPYSFEVSNKYIPWLSLEVVLDSLRSRGYVDSLPPLPTDNFTTSTSI